METLSPPVGRADYIVAGLLIEKVTGRTWEREVTDRIIGAAFPP